MWWEGDQFDGSLTEYQMTSHPHNATSPPFCANIALRRNATDWGHLYEKCHQSFARQLLHRRLPYAPANCSARVSGLELDATGDKLQFTSNTRVRPLTRRGLPSIVSSVLLFILTGKMMFQQLD